MRPEEHAAAAIEHRQQPHWSETGRERQNSNTNSEFSSYTEVDEKNKEHAQAHIRELGGNNSGDEESQFGDQERQQTTTASSSTERIPPADRGKDAWLFLAACFVMEALVWGFPFAFGVFQDYYRTNELFKGSSDIAIIGTCAMGIMYLGSPFAIAYQRLWPRIGRFSPAIGLIIMCLALGLSSFSTNSKHLILTQGALYGIGGSIGYNPCLIYLDEWFVRRKGMAYGMMWSGTGLGGVAVPLILEALLDKYGFRTTLRIWAVALFVLNMPLVYFVKPRLPPSATTHINPLDFDFAKTRVFALYSLGNLLESLGFFLPSIFLPEYARSLGASHFGAALTLLVLNIGSTAGCVTMGTLVDRLEVTTCIFMCTIGTSIAVFLVWGLGSSLPTLYIFCILYGLFAGTYTSTWPGIMKGVGEATKARKARLSGLKAKPDNNDETSSYDPLMLIALLAVGRGIGNIASGPLSEVLVAGKPWRGQTIGGYGSGYGILIVVTGVTALLGGISCIFKRLGWV